MADCPHFHGCVKMPPSLSANYKPWIEMVELLTRVDWHMSKSGWHRLYIMRIRGSHALTQLVQSKNSKCQGSQTCLRPQRLQVPT